MLRIESSATPPTNTVLVLAPFKATIIGPDLCGSRRFAAASAVDDIGASPALERIVQAIAGQNIACRTANDVFDIAQPILSEPPTATIESDAALRVRTTD